jgi:hypothetical protein
MQAREGQTFICDLVSLEEPFRVRFCLWRIFETRAVPFRFPKVRGLRWPSFQFERDAIIIQKIFAEHSSQARYHCQVP